MTSGAGAAYAGSPCSTSGLTTTCTYTKGTGQTWTVPAGVYSATFDVYGAQGHGASPVSDSWQGGPGGEVSGTLGVSPGQSHQIDVGGVDGTNGGGAGGLDFSGNAEPDGGGASDVFGVGAGHFLLIAGGGGWNWMLYAVPGTGGTGTSVSGTGSIGVGGQGASSPPSGSPYYGDGGAGGGGGYQGGGGSLCSESGAGGSNYAAPSVANVTSQRGVQSGDGKVVPTYSIGFGANVLYDLPGSNPIAPPGAAEWSDGSQARADVFYIDPSGNLEQWFITGSGTWRGPYNLGGSLKAGTPAAVSWGPGRLDIFARGSDNSLQHKFWDGNANGGTWSNWESLGGGLNSDPTVASWGPGRLDVFYLDSQGHLEQEWYNGSWNGPYNLGGSLTSVPSAVSWGPNRIDIVARGSSNDAQHLDWNGSVWSNWESLGGTLTSAPSITSNGSGLLDVFARGGDNYQYELSFTSGGWGSWAHVSSPPSPNGDKISVIDGGGNIHFGTWKGTNGDAWFDQLQW